jgi:biotin carboxylase
LALLFTVTLGLKRRARDCIGYRNSVVPESDRLISNLEDAITQVGNIGYLVLVKGLAENGRIGFAPCSAVNSLRWTFGNLRQLSLINFGHLVVFIEHLLIVQGALGCKSLVVVQDSYLCW